MQKKKMEKISFFFENSFGSYTHFSEAHTQTQTPISAEGMFFFQMEMQFYTHFSEIVEKRRKTRRETATFPFNY
jgi:hypothetical protein